MTIIQKTIVLVPNQNKQEKTPALKHINNKNEPISFGSDPSTLEAIKGGMLGTFLFTGGPSLIILGILWAVTFRKNIAAKFSKVYQNTKTFCNNIIKK